MDHKQAMFRPKRTATYEIVLKRPKRSKDRGQFTNSKFALVFVAIFAFSLVASVTKLGQAQSIQEMRERINQGVVGIMCGRTTASFIYFCEDMAFLINDDIGYSLRAIPMVGSGALRNVEDLIYLRGVDLTITLADTLDYMQKQGIHPNIKEKVRYVTRLWDLELHILADENIKSIYDLQGKKVNFSVIGSGTFLTMTNLFEKLGIQVDVQSDNKSAALQRLKKGEIAAMASTSAVPWKFAAQFGPGDGLHLLDVPPEALPDGYETATWSSDVYPNLIEAGTTVRTLRNPAVLLAYNWPEHHPRCGKVQRFMTALRQEFPNLLEEPHQPKWKEVNLDAEVKNLVRWDKSC
ncbi:MAG: TAXI family TRAP transporter solute-binding subunit [Geminicoccaceae bacterium]